jgi:hypothetical protein
MNLVQVHKKLAEAQFFLGKMIEEERRILLTEGCPSISSRSTTPVHLGLRQPEQAGDPVAREMRLQRAGRQRRTVGPRVDDGTGRTHATSGTR